MRTRQDPANHGRRAVAARGGAGAQWLFDHPLVAGAAVAAPTVLLALWVAVGAGQGEGDRLAQLGRLHTCSAACRCSQRASGGSEPMPRPRRSATPGRSTP